MSFVSLKSIRPDSQHAKMCATKGLLSTDKGNMLMHWKYVNVIH